MENTDIKNHRHLHRGLSGGPLRAYILGFLLSIVFTITAFVLVMQHSLPKDAIIVFIFALAFAQFAVQLLCFLHLNREIRPRWHVFVFALMIAVVIIVVTGSLWIMFNLNDRMMPSMDEINTYMQSQTGL